MREILVGWLLELHCNIFSKNFTNKVLTLEKAWAKENDVVISGLEVHQEPLLIFFAY